VGLAEEGENKIGFNTGRQVIKELLKYVTIYKLMLPAFTNLQTYQLQSHSFQFIINTYAMPGFSKPE